MKITEWPHRERPRERLRESGPRSVSDAELLAIALGTGHPRTGESAVDLARRLLALAGGAGLRGLWELGVDGLAAVPGVGPAKAAQVLAALELGRRAWGQGLRRRRIRSPADAYAVLAPEFAGADREHFYVLLLDRKNGVLGVELVAVGGLDAAPAEPREVFKPAVRASAAALIVAHNHPSGDPEPSPEDVAVTSRLAEAGGILGIEVLDHIIVGGTRYVSLREQGVMG